VTPAAGSGIKYAIEDAVVAANLLAAPLLAGRLRVENLAEVQRRRECPTRVIQAIGAFGLSRMGHSLRSGRQQTVPRFVRTLFGVRVFSKGVARMLAFGLWRVHVQGEPVERSADQSAVA